jgi:3-hydroxyacyl-[acyl-carrier-protein] dehydratase
LVKRAKDGDERALATLCERHAPKVEKLARHLLRDPEDARDAAQESLAKLCVRIKQFRGDSQFATWLHRLVVNTCHDVAVRQRARTHEPLHEDERVSFDADPAHEADLSALRSELNASLAGIPSDQARVVGDLVRFGDAGRHREVLRAPRAKSPARAARDARRRVNLPLQRAEIESILPHRPPMLLLDEVVELEPGSRVVAHKTVREEDCAGHFPGNPIMPGVLMVEALAQAGAVAVLSEEANRGKLALFAGIDDVRFKRLVRPGDMLRLQCDVETVRGPIGRGKARATVNGELAVRGTLTFAVGAEP